jgi:hypothetical protein
LWGAKTARCRDTAPFSARACEPWVCLTLHVLGNPTTRPNV